MVIARGMPIRSVQRLEVIIHIFDLRAFRDLVSQGQKDILHLPLRLRYQMLKTRHPSGARQSRVYSDRLFEYALFFFEEAAIFAIHCLLKKGFHLIGFLSEKGSFVGGQRTQFFQDALADRPFFSKEAHAQLFQHLRVFGGFDRFFR